jgi:hypothetical protein
MNHLFHVATHSRLNTQIDPNVVFVLSAVLKPAFKPASVKTKIDSKSKLKGENI